MAVPSKFAREQYEALLAEEDSNRRRTSDLKSHFKKTIKNLRSTFTPKSNEKSGTNLQLSSAEWLPQDRMPKSQGFLGGHKLASALASSSTLASNTGSDSKSGSSPNSSGTTLLSQFGDPEDAPAPWDSGLDLITPASSQTFNVDSTCKPFSRTVRRVSHGSIHCEDGEYIHFGSINTGKVTLHRTPSIQSQSAISISNVELDNVEWLAGEYREIGDLVDTEQLFAKTSRNHIGQECRFELSCGVARRSHAVARAMEMRGLRTKYARVPPPSPAKAREIRRARAHGADPGPGISPKNSTNQKRPSLDAQGSSSSEIRLSEQPNGTAHPTRAHQRSESQVWLPEDAISSERPSWASIGHHAIVPWRSSFRSEENRTIRLVHQSDDSEHGIDEESIWSPLESDIDPLLQSVGPQEDGRVDESVSYADWLRAPKPRENQPAMPTRSPPPPPPTSNLPQDSETAAVPEQLERECRPPKVEKKSRFVEHLPENRKQLKKLGIPAWSYEEDKFRRISDWFGSLKKISSR
ncbi:hypothetical protein PRZ48_014891 [Zasmidium cellare]|uniref:Uncharacterized protein n=1 Tax=Zasmidium cellare TaxID=395010 RepID=A0ABR0DXM0_ZASCE|nr:hypothetical protein PRZ48_014891 [Zasmidium cellare]